MKIIILTLLILWAALVAPQDQPVASAATTKPGRAKYQTRADMHAARLRQGARETLDDVLTMTKSGVYVISSPDEKRTAHVQNFLEDMGLMSRTEFFPQTDKNKFHNGKFTERLIKAKQIDKIMAGRRAAAGVFACSFSHKTLLDAFLKSNNEIAIIFEDDVVQMENATIAHTQKQLARLLSIPKREWNIQYPGFCFELCQKCDDTCARCLNLEHFHGSSNPLYAPAMRPLCTHALIFDRVAAQILVNNFYPVHDAYDNYITDTACRFDLKAIRPSVPIFTQDRGKLGTLINVAHRLYEFELKPHKNVVAYLYYCRNKFKEDQAMQQDIIAGTGRGFQHWEFWARNVRPLRLAAAPGSFNASLAVIG